MTLEFPKDFLKIKKEYPANSYCIYTLSEPNGDIRYVGKTSIKRLRATYYRHIVSDLKTNRNPYKNRWIINLKETNQKPIFNIIVLNLQEDEAFSEEIKVISEYKEKGMRLTNITNGGEGASGLKHSNITIKKIKTWMQSNNPFRGKTHSEETKKIISEVSKSVNRECHTLETRKKISQSNIGKHSLKKEHLKKMIEASLRSPNRFKLKPQQKKPIIALKLNTNSIINFNSTKEASQALGIASSNITRALKENRTAGGYTFKYKEMENI